VQNPSTFSNLASRFVPQTEELHHVDLGVGPSVVLIHGLASNLHLWDGVAKRLEGDRHRVVACDLRGHGHSPKPAGPYDVETVAGDVIALIERLELGACLLAGQSYGATVALQVAAERPDLTAAVVCVDGGFSDLRRRWPEWETCRRDLSPPPLTGRPLKAIRFRMRAERPGWPEEGLEGQLACFEVREDGTVAPWLTRERHLEVLHGLWEVDAAALWARVKAPVMLVVAERPGSPRKSLWHDDVDRCHAVLVERTRVEVIWMEGDHDLHAQHPDQIASLLERWGRGDS
jgi:pimeloyl-ACP methyl ester carboxylesterase